MKSSKRVTELNNRSVELTDAELRFVDKFSVSLPMNELPEVVVISPQPVAPPRNYQGPATIPFKMEETETKSAAIESEPETHSATPDHAPFSREQATLNSVSPKPASENPVPKKNPNTHTETSADQRTGATNDHAPLDRDSNGISMPDIQDAESVLLETHPYEPASNTETPIDDTSRHETSAVHPPVADSPHTALNESADAIESFASDLELELPQDELDIFSSDDSPIDGDTESIDKAENAPENEADSETVSNSENVPANVTAIYKIEDYAIYENRFERIAKGVEAELENKPSSVVLMTSPGPNESMFSPNSIQHATANNLLSVLANRNPTMRIISVQANEAAIEQGEQFTPGLGEILSEENELEDVVIPTTIDNLDYLAFSDCRSLRSSSFKPRAEKMVSELRKHYDLIFINGKSAKEMETQSWTTIADATYLIVQLYGDDQSVAKDAAIQLRKNGARLVGCIVIEPE